ncbi:UNVERIFIED_CONTAM: hypothetical protein FKN15_035622 [Acipenser sinensis]
MNLEGLEMIAVLVVIVLFVKALEQFGLLESYTDGYLQLSVQADGTAAMTTWYCHRTRCNALDLDLPLLSAVHRVMHGLVRCPSRYQCNARAVPMNNARCWCGRGLVLRLPQSGAVHGWYGHGSVPKLLPSGAVHGPVRYQGTLLPRPSAVNWVGAVQAGGTSGALAGNRGGSTQG